MSKPSQTAANKKLAEPTARTRAAAREVGQPAAVTLDTTTGESKRPRLPPPATSALAVAPAENHFTAITSRKVLPAVSKMPAVPARSSS